MLKKFANSRMESISDEIRSIVKHEDTLNGRQRQRLEQLNRSYWRWARVSG